MPSIAMTRARVLKTVDGIDVLYDPTRVKLPAAMPTPQPSPPPPPTTAPKRRVGVVVPILVAAGIMFLGADFIPLSLRPLDHLGIPYPPILRYAHFILPAAFVAVCLTFNRSHAAAILALLLTTTASGGVARWADAQPAKVRVTRTVYDRDFDGWLTTLDFPVWQTADQDGPQMWVDRAPGRAERLTAEAKRLGICRP
jgi:hypothetical protein